MKRFSLLVVLSIIYLSNNSPAQKFWQPTNGPYNPATVNDFLKYDDSTIFIATTEGIIKSTDNGINWARVATTAANCLSVDSTHTLYAATTTLIVRSTDKGVSWSKVNSIPVADFRNILITYRDTIIAGSSNNGLFRTTDHGTSWLQINNGLGTSSIRKTIILSNRTLLTCTQTGVYKSSDLGTTWDSCNTGIPANGLGYKDVNSLLEISPGEILSSTPKGIYYSSDYGNTWSNRSNGFGNLYANYMAIDDKGNLYAAQDVPGGIYASTNKGISWNSIKLNFPVYTIGWNSSKDLFAGGLSHGLYKFSSTDSSWNQVYNKGFTPIRVDVLAVSDNENLFAGTFFGVYKSTNKGQSWDNTSFTKQVGNIIAIDDSTIVLGGDYLSRDMGKTWKQIADFYASAVYYDSKQQILYVGTNFLGNLICGIYATSDLGQNWKLISQFQHLGQGTWVDKLIVTAKSKYIFANVQYGDRGNSWSYFQRSIDSGQTYTTINQDYIYDIIENYNGILYVADNSKILVSNDEGLTWTSKVLYGGAECLAPDYLGRIYYGILTNGNEYVICSDEDVNNVLFLDNAMPGVYSLAISKNNIIYVATDKGVYRGDANNIVLDLKNEKSTILSYSLSQNYPNPFNPSTSIKYALPSDSKVSIKIYNILGQDVKLLKDEIISAGNHEVQFNSPNLPSGVYLYRLNAESLDGKQKFSSTKKMILLK